MIQPRCHIRHIGRNGKHFPSVFWPSEIQGQFNRFNITLHCIAMFMEIVLMQLQHLKNSNKTDYIEIHGFIAKFFSFLFLLHLSLILHLSMLNKYCTVKVSFRRYSPGCSLLFLAHSHSTPSPHSSPDPYFSSYFDLPLPLCIYASSPFYPPLISSALPPHLNVHIFTWTVTELIHSWNSTLRWSGACQKGISW